MEVFRKLVHVGRARGGEKSLVQGIRRSGGTENKLVWLMLSLFIAVARCP